MPAHDSTLHFVEYPLQIAALVWMATMYTIKARQLSKMAVPYDKAPPKGNAVEGVKRSYIAPFLPGTMESTRKHPGRWVEFFLYHVAVAAALLATFTMPFAKSLMTQTVRDGFAVAIAPGAFLGIVKLLRRMTSPELKIVSTIDDYFALVVMEVFFVSGIQALLTDARPWRMTFFLVTAGLIFYVPFSKISHYVYFFFGRFLTGNRYGYRGVVAREGGKTWA